MLTVICPSRITQTAVFLKEQGCISKHVKKFDLIPEHITIL